MDFARTSPEDRGSLPPRPAASSPMGLPASSPKRRFAKLGRKPSEGSLQSGSSSSSARSAESVSVIVRQPSKSRVRRHTNRLSGVFLRGPSPNSSPMALAGELKSSLYGHARKDNMSSGNTPITDDPFELSNQITAPGILKIFGSEICEGAHYKSVLATTHSSARELVKEALERYGLSKEEAGSYVLCDAIGSIGDHRWKTEGFRVVGDNEKPLLLQSLWKPREGLARRFEIQRRSSVDEKRSKEEDTVTAGINAQARKLQKSRSRVTSTLVEKAMARGRCQTLWRSKSEMDLLGLDTEEAQEEEDADQNHCQENQNQSPENTAKLNPTQNHIQSHVAIPPREGGAGSGGDTEGLCLPRGRRAEQESEREDMEREEMEREETEREETEREETESSDENSTQYSIHPPHDCPYLLLLQGYSLPQDFVIYLLTRQSVVIGQSGENEGGSKVDLVLFAPDILPRHCCLHRHGNGNPTLLRPCQGATVTRNGKTLSKEEELRPGDVVGLGQRYLFLFKDPVALVTMHKELNDGTPEPDLSVVLLGRSTSTPATTPTSTLLCNTCISACTDPHRPRGKWCPKTDSPFLRDPEGLEVALRYEVELEVPVLKEIVAMGMAADGPALTVAFLLCLCVQYSAADLHTSDLRRLLLHIASRVQSSMWECTKELAAAQPEVGEGSDPEEPQPLDLEELMSGLHPLVIWMSNGLELLHFIQHKLPLILDWRTQREQQQEEDGEREEEEDREEENMALLELRLSCVRSASEETMTVLEEVIMLTFQQCVYYITKVLYPILPGILDSDPFGGGGELQNPAQSALLLGTGDSKVPGDTKSVVEVLAETRRLLLECLVHPEISSQVLAYLFYFINASLFNSLMERGSEAGFYQWSRGVRMRASLDLVLDWAHGSGSGLGELALEHTHTLSSAINLLATPRDNLLQASWVSLRSDFPALSPPQLHHLLSCYSPASPSPHTWVPSPQDRPAVHRTADILLSFDTHHPLVLPGGGYHLELGTVLPDPALRNQLDRLQEVISTFSVSHPLRNAGVKEQQALAVPLEAKLNKMVTLPKASLESMHSPPVKVVSPQPPVQGTSSSSPASVATPPSPSSPSSTRNPGGLAEFTSCGALLLSQKLWSLELQTREVEPGRARRSALDPSCLLTPPNTPHDPELAEVECRDAETKGDGETRPDDASWSSVVDLHEEGGLVSECLAALMTDRLRFDSPNKERSVELKEQEEEENYDNGDGDDNYGEDVFSLELQRDDRGLGLALVDALDTSLRINGIFIRAVEPDSPAARCERLVPGDRILAVNGISLLDLDYHRGRELIQASGDRPRLLVARCDWTAKALLSEC